MRFEHPIPALQCNLNTTTVLIYSGVHASCEHDKYRPLADYLVVFASILPNHVVVSVLLTNSSSSTLTLSLLHDLIADRV